MNRLLVLLPLACASTSGVHAAEWSDTELQLLYGSGFHDNSNQTQIAKTIVTLQNSAGFKFGRTYFFLDYAKSNSKDDRRDDFYSEGYLTVSSNRVAGFTWGEGALKDVGLTLGYNLGRKNSEYGPRVRAAAAGVTFDFKVRYFDFFNLDVLGYRDVGAYRGFGGGALCGSYGSTYLVTPYWKLPFTIGGERFSYEGFLDVIGAHGTCKTTIISQSQLRWDVGNHFGTPNKVLMGFEYQFWRNKFGIQGRRESLFQAVLIWKL